MKSTENPSFIFFLNITHHGEATENFLLFLELYIIHNKISKTRYYLAFLEKRKNENRRNRPATLFFPSLGPLGPAALLWPPSLLLLFFPTPADPTQFGPALLAHRPGCSRPPGRWRCPALVSPLWDDSDDETTIYTHASIS
jgi:hypothetical protein